MESKDLHYNYSPDHKFRCTKVLCCTGLAVPVNIIMESFCTHEPQLFVFYQLEKPTSSLSTLHPLRAASTHYCPAPAKLLPRDALSPPKYSLFLM